MPRGSFGFKVRRIGKIKRAPNWGDAVVNEIQKVLEEDHQVGLGKELDRVVANWENKPGFVIRAGYNYKAPGRQSYTGIQYARGAITLGYRVVGSRKIQQIYNWVNLGTRPHKIRAKNAKRLAFEWGGPGSYQAKTKPGGASLQFGGPGTVTGGEMHYPVEVDHPGTKPRDIDGYIARKLATKFRSAVRRAVKLGLALANQRHGAIKAQRQVF